ncbi:MAG TPA: bifunctional acetate--CoA ligase family protein/GNAT family N-acetyltransferase [Tepidisphaeraceae bacterium]|nr:bifunctional acetate--CoA ligase family protein/GNAT family N-acetyltransferase [Tepidisphaeraceae bacterium]
MNQALVIDNPQQGGQRNSATRPPCALDKIFLPRSVAVVGATETVGSVGRTVMSNLLRSPFGGPVYPVNPKRRSVLGVQCWPDLKDLPEQVDLAVVCTPASAVPGVIERCAAAGVSAAIVISAGFREMGEPGAVLEDRILKIARGANMRLIGPNCLGVMSPHHGLNATFAAGIARPGKVAFLSQSGALCTAVLDWSLREKVGFSSFVSTGSMLDVNWGDLIDYFGDDPETQSILIYMESIGDVQSFMSAAREVALTKPIIVIKTGRTAAAAKAAASHTGALTGSDEVLEAAFRRAGVLRVDRISDLFYMAEVLARAPRPAGKRMAIVTNAGGPGVLATDALVGGGGELAKLSDQTITELNQALPPHWSRGNPVDLLGDGGADRYSKVLDIVGRDPGNDGLLVILTPQDMTDPTGIAEKLRHTAAGLGKPVLASWMGADTVEEGKAILNKASIATFDFPDSAARAFNYMWRYAENLKSLYETPAIGESMEGLPSAAAEASRIIDGARAEKRTILTEAETKELLSAYGIPVTRTHTANSAEAAAAAANKIGYPVVLKLLSHTLTHKSDVGGVQLNLKDAAAVTQAFQTIKANVTRAAGEHHFEGVTVQRMIQNDGQELILGSSCDGQFGPVILFGLGGKLVEIFKDRALGLPPLNDVLARRMMEQTRIYAALKGVRGSKGIDQAELERTIVRFSQLVTDQPWLKEVEINPLLASPQGLMGLDARAILHDLNTPVEKLRRPAIRPYPRQHMNSVTLRDGSKITLRPIRPEDEPLMVQFHQGLSEQSVRSRYFCAMSLGQRISHERLVRVCLSDYDSQIALVADRINLADNKHEIVGVARLSKLRGTNDAEFAIIVSDTCQHAGLGTVLMQSLLRVAREEKVERVTGEILADNTAMLSICQKAGFTLTAIEGDSATRAELRL